MFGDRKGGAGVRRTTVIGWLIVLAGLVVGGFGAGVALAAGGGLPVGAITVSPPAVALGDGQVVSVSGVGFASRAAVVVVQCSVNAATGGADFCNERFVAVAPTDDSGSFTARFRVHPVIQTAAGTVDCRVTACLLGAENLGDRSQLAATGVTFAPGRPAAPPPAVSSRPQAVPRSGVVAIARPGAPARLPVLAPLAADISAGRIGVVAGTRSRGVPRRPVRGEGLLELTLSAPGTSWRSSRDTSVVVEAAVDGGPPQAMVLFAGARPFTYEGFTGPLRTGRHQVSVRVRPDLSPTQDVVPTAAVHRAQLLVVAPRNPGYRALAYAPVLYDRGVVAHSDTPQLTYASVSPRPGGAKRISYVVVWSNEDAGTGFVPFLLRGGFGRMNDIEDALSLTVDRHGAIHDSVYLGCTTCGPGFPENRTALDETFRPFHGAHFGHHPILRVATGNNDFSDQGNTPYRFQQALAAPPLSGQTREGAMDRNPWTYAITDQEVQREREDFSTDPASPAPGDTRQYLIVALDAATQNVAAVGVDLRLADDPRLYRNDFDTTYPLYTGGLGRTVVKVPLSEVDRPITALALRLQSSSSQTAIHVRCLRVLQYTHEAIVERRAPSPSVILEPLPSLSASPAAVAGATVSPACPARASSPSTNTRPPPRHRPSRPRFTG